MFLNLTFLRNFSPLCCIKNFLLYLVIYYWDIFTAVCVISKSIIPIGVSWKMFVNFEKLSIFRYLSNQTKLLAL